MFQIDNIPEIKISLSFDKKIKKSELYTIHTSHECSQVLRRIFNADTFDWVEEFILLCMNQANKIIGFCKISKGGVTATVADPRVILTTALNCPGTTSIILSHNHPSGNLKPSLQDEDMTKRIKEAAKLLDIRLLDHLILSDEGYYSFADNGQI